MEVYGEGPIPASSMILMPLSGPVLDVCAMAGSSPERPAGVKLEQCSSLALPGRVTLIGDHTDYNQGLSLPMAIDLATEASFTPKLGSFLVGVTSDQFDEPWEIALGNTAPSPPQAVLAGALLDLGAPPSGGAMKVTSTIPVGAGLSSSAAFSVAFLLALGLDQDLLEMATSCQTAEEAAGSRVGLLDPLAILGARAGHALSIDFATLDMHQVAVPEAAAFVVVHCGTGRELGTSLYADRRAECESAENLIGKPLGQCELGDLSGLPGSVLRRRARHVITECTPRARGRAPLGPRAICVRWARS